MAAKCRSIAFSLALTLLLSPLSSIGQSQTEETERREFLFNLGFNDVSSIIRQKLKNKEYATELNRRQMNVNIQAYEVINAARELAIVVLSELGANSSKNRVDQLSLFAAKMLALKPMGPSFDYPSHILNLKDEEERETQLVEWLRKERIQQMNEHKKKLLSDVVTLLYGGSESNEIRRHTVQIKRMDQLLSQIVQCMYLDDTLGNGRYFGRALLALTLREEKIRGGDFSGIKDKITKELKGSHNLYIENFIGDEMILVTPKGEQKVKIVNGTEMLSRNLSSGSLSISIAAIPKNLSDRWKARFRGMIGTPLANFLYVEPEDMNDGITLGMRIRDRIAQSGILRMGYSHIVYYQVLEDKKTGIKMARVIDNYPNRVYDMTGKYIRTGGTRLTYPEQVIDASHHSAVYFSNPVAEKQKKWSEESVAKFGYQKEFSPSVELELDKEGVTPIKNDRVLHLKTDISESDFKQLHAETSAKKLSERIGVLFTEGLVDTVYEGTIFHWPDPYDFHLVAATYCSQLGDIVMRKKVGIPLEFHGSTWHWGVRALAKLGNAHKAFQKLPGVEKSMKLTTIPIIAPITLALQPFMEGQGYTFVAKTPEQKVQSSYMLGSYREVDANTTSAIQSSVPLISYQDTKRNVILEYGAAMRDIEHGIVMRASQGIKTPHLSTENIAQLGAKKATPGIRLDWSKNGCEGYLKN